MVKKIGVFIYTNPYGEEVRRGFVKHTLEGYFQIITSRGEKLEIIRNKPINYQELIEQGKALEIKKIHVADVIITDKGIEGITNVSSQKHSAKLLEILEELKNRKTVESPRGVPYAEIESNHKLYAWAIYDILIDRGYMAEHPE